MILSIFMTALSLSLILLSCYIFINGIEQVGEKLNLHQGIVGSILAAIGTALPETIIPIMAIIITNTPNSHQIGIGAIAGAPFMLGTLAFFITGAAVLVYAALGKRTTVMNADISLMRKDLIFFLIIYGIAVLTTFFHHQGLRIIIAIILMCCYLFYLKLTINSGTGENEDVEELYLHRFFHLPEKLTYILLQIFLGLVLIIFGSHLFIKYVEELSFAFGVAPLILSILITPIATELPEKMNSIIWIGRQKDTLAIGNITGAMVFQSCFPVVFGIIFTPWNLTGTTMLSAISVLVSAFFILCWISLFKKINPYILTTGGIFYLILITNILKLFP